MKFCERPSVPWGLFYVRDNTYLVIWKICPYLLKVYNSMMPNNSPTLQEQAAFCRTRIDQCADIIKQFSGDVPTGFTFTFSIRRVPIVDFELTEGEGNFAVSFFMGWHQYYSRKLQQINKELALT
jgi:hypothetical protein